MRVLRIPMTADPETSVVQTLGRWHTPIAHDPETWLAEEEERLRQNGHVNLARSTPHGIPNATLILSSLGDRVCATAYIFFDDDFEGVDWSTADVPR